MSCAYDTTAFKVKMMFFPLSCLYVLLFFLAAVLHVEGQNVYYPKILKTAASGGGSLSAQWGF